MRNQVLGRKQCDKEGETTGLQETVIWTQVPETVPGKEGSIEGDTMRKTQRPGKEKQVTREGDRSQQTQTPGKEIQESTEDDTKNTKQREIRQQIEQ